MLSASGNSAYIEPAQICGSNDRLRALAAIEKTRIRAVLQKLSEAVAPIAHDIVALCEELLCIDAAGARAEIAEQLVALDVQFLDSNTDEIVLRVVRHPLLALIARAKSNQEDGEQVDWKTQIVPQGFLVPQGVCVCITEPNPGGKTVALKTLGLVSLMAKAIAQRLGLESGIIDDARLLLIGGEGSNRVDFERLSKGLDQQKRQADKDALVAADLKSEATELRQKAMISLQITRVSKYSTLPSKKKKTPKNGDERILTRTQPCRIV